MQARTSVAVVVKAGCKSESPRFSTLCVFFFFSPLFFSDHLAFQPVLYVTTLTSQRKNNNNKKGVVTSVKRYKKRERER